MAVKKTAYDWEGVVFYQVNVAEVDEKLVSLGTLILTWSSCALDFETEL